jgi:4-amino-4-deoxy-L-arabinose transferase-like glycosyltransferase
LWFGWGLFILLFNRKLLVDKRLYIAGVITIICILPIVYWNIQNDFITYTYHSKRVTHRGIELDSFLREIVGEVIYQNPLVFIAVVIPFFQFKKLQLAISKEALQLLLLLSLPILIVFWGISLFNPTLPHWTGPAYIALILLASVYWSKYSLQMIPKIIQSAMGFLLFVIIGFVILVYVFPTQLGSLKKENLGEYNPINDVTGWDQCNKQFATIRQKDLKAGIMQEKDPFVINKWFPGGHILFYIASPNHMSVIGMGQLEDLHKFQWLNKKFNALEVGEDAYTIVPSNLPLQVDNVYGKHFQKMDTAGVIPVIQRKVLLRNFYVIRLKGYQP